MTVVSAYAAAVALPAAVGTFCYLPGEPCTRLERAVNAVAEVIAEPPADVLEARHSSTTNSEGGWLAPRNPHLPHHHQFCYMTGESCSEAKRSLLALAESVAEADNIANPQAKRSPFSAGEPANIKMRRDIETRENEAVVYLEAEPEARALYSRQTSKPGAESKDPHLTAAAHDVCFSPGEPCLQLQKARGLVEAAINERSSFDLEPADEKQVYAMHKRALDGLAQKMMAMV